MIINLILLTFITCFIIDISGIMKDVKKLIFRILNIKSHDISAIRLKPFDCSTCMCFWGGVIYLLCTGQFNLYSLAIVSFLSAISQNISGFIQYFKELLVFIENKLYKLISEI